MDAQNKPRRKQRQHNSERDVAYLSEYEVQRRYDSLVRLIQGRGFSRDKKIKLEIDACYIWRELEHRKTRKSMHAEYLKKFNKNRRYRGGRKNG